MRSDSGSPTGVDTPSEVNIVVSDEQTDVEIDALRWERLAHDVLVAEGRVGELTLTFVGHVDMAELNVEHMGKQGPTDVLSFPLDAFEHAAPVPDCGPVLLGDVVICPSVAAAAAPAHAGTVDDEIALLVVHGILHVLGHDHAEPDETHRMRSREIDHLTRLHWQGSPPAGFVHEQQEQQEEVS